MLERYTENLHTNIYLNAAKKLGLDFKIIFKEGKYVGINHSGKSLRIIDALVSVNDAVASRLARSKYLTGQVLEQNGIPVPKQKLFKSTTSFTDEDEQDEILKYAEKNFPVVIKPTNKYGGTGVFADIKSLADTEKALDQLKELGINKLLIEEHVYGKDYRVLVYKDQILDVLERIPAFVTGDGTKTIQGLIDEKNAVREKNNASLIKVDTKLKNFIDKKSYKLESVLEKDEVVSLRNNCNFSEGGETKRIDISEVHQDNLEMFKKINFISRLELSGIDFISPDITKSYKEIKSAINEINSMPGMDAHYFADMKLDLVAAIKILTLYFEIK